MKTLNMRIYNAMWLFARRRIQATSNTTLTSVRSLASQASLDKKQAGLDKRQHDLMGKGLPKQKTIPGVKNIILVASGKGGVGKSTTAVNLATAMATIQPKLEIGLLDADVFGPSIPLMMNVNETPLLTEDDLMVPLINYGVKCMSMGFLVTEQSAIMWRGLMVMSALEKLMRKVHWGHIDCLVVDTPPGTGDTHLSLIQNLPLSGVVLVTTPQQAALQVVRRGITMFNKLNIPIIGIVQNMSNVRCPNCDSSISLFGNGTHQLAEEHGLAVLGDIPLDSDITNSGDSGKPIVVAQPHSPQAMSYIRVAEKVTAFIKKRNMTKEEIAR